MSVLLARYLTAAQILQFIIGVSVGCFTFASRISFDLGLNWAKDLAVLQVNLLSRCQTLALHTCRVTLTHTRTILRSCVYLDITSRTKLCMFLCFCRLVLWQLPKCYLWFGYSVLVPGSFRPALLQKLSGPYSLVHKLIRSDSFSTCHGRYCVYCVDRRCHGQETQVKIARNFRRGRVTDIFPTPDTCTRLSRYTPTKEHRMKYPVELHHTNETPNRAKFFLFL